MYIRSKYEEGQWCTGEYNSTGRKRTLIMECWRHDNLVGAKLAARSEAYLLGFIQVQRQPVDSNSCACMRWGLNFCDKNVIWKRYEIKTCGWSWRWRVQVRTRALGEKMDLKLALRHLMNYNGDKKAHSCENVTEVKKRHWLQIARTFSI